MRFRHTPDIEKTIAPLDINPTTPYMKNKKSLTLTSLFAALFCLLPSLLFAQEKKVLAVYLKDDTSVYFLLSEEPVVSFIDDSVQIISDTNEATIKRSFVNEFKFLDELPAKIENIPETDEHSTNEHYELTGNAIVIEGLLPGHIVRLLSLDGKVIKSKAADDNGNVTISFESLSPNIYIITFNKTAIKFIKS